MKEECMKKIVFLDLDGTFWEFEKVPESALKAILSAKENGHKIFVNTGRTKCEVPDSLWELNLDGYCFSAGSEIYLNKERILYQPLGVKIAKEIQNIMEKYHCAYSMEGSNITYINELNRIRMAEFSKENRIGNKFISFPDVSLMKEEDYKQIMKISIHLEKEEDKEKILKELPEEVLYTEFRKFGGEITLKQYNKATAIQFLETYFHNEYQSMAIGDSENDIPMLKYAQISIAMGNGSDCVKEICDYVTDNINKDGLYKAFYHYHLI